MLKDRPGSAAALVVAAVVVHVLLARRWESLDTAAAVSEADELVSLYMGFAGVAALVASFVGVLVVFATITGEAWSVVRNLGGHSLIRNWLSPIRSTFSAAILASLAALLEQIGHGRVAWWLFELAALTLIAAALRVLWLLGGLLTAQQNIDKAATGARRQLTLKDLNLPDRNAS